MIPVLALAAACGNALDPLEAHLEASIKNAQETAVVLRTIKDKASAEAARPKIEALVKRREELTREWDSFPPAVRSGPPPDTPRIRQLSSQLAHAANGLVSTMEFVDRITQKDPAVRQILISAGVEKLVGRAPR